jgi:hypothetical protein
MRTIEEITEPDWDAEKEIADYEVHKLRQRAIFRPEWVGRQVAEEVTRKFLEENLFHFRDTRWCMESFLMTPFPYGSRPIDLIRDLRIYVRCEDFVYWAGITVPRMMEEMELEEPDYGDEVGTYDIIHGNVQCLLRIPFNKNQKIRLVIVELFGRYGLDTMDLDLVRIGMNFEEAILEAYVKLKSEAADVQVASIVDDEFDVLSGAMELSRSWLDILHTWEIELAAQHFHTVSPIIRVPFRVRHRYFIVLTCNRGNLQGSIPNMRTPIAHLPVILAGGGSRSMNSNRKKHRNAKSKHCRYKGRTKLGTLHILHGIIDRCPMVSKQKAEIQAGKARLQICTRNTEVKNPGDNTWSRYWLASLLLPGCRLTFHLSAL